MFDLANWKQDHFNLYHPFRAMEGWEKEFWHPTFRSDFRVDLRDCGENIQKQSKCSLGPTKI